MSKLATAVLLALFTVSLCLAADFVPAGKGIAPAVLVVPAGKKADFMTAAQDMQKYVKLITGTELKIVPASQGKRIEFAVSRKMDADSFRVTFPQKDVMLLTGGSPLRVPRLVATESTFFSLRSAII